MTLGRHCSFVPPYLLERIAASDSAAADHCRGTLAVDQVFRSSRESVSPPTATTATTPAWVVHTASNASTLPGRAVRTAGEPESGDVSVDEAATGITGTLALFEEVFARSSYDGKGAAVSLTVHYERDYDNAFWDGTQLVFGDGDGTGLRVVHASVDVLGHEFTHAVTEHTAGLPTRASRGRSTSRVSDSSRACLKQRVLGQTADEADWLIGEGIFVPSIQARALRDMADPGHGVRRPGARPGPAGRAPRRLRRHRPTTTAGSTSTPASPTAPSSSPPPRSAVDTWEGAGRVWYAALTGGDVARRHRLRRLRRAHDRGRRRRTPTRSAQAWAAVGVDAGFRGVPPAEQPVGRRRRRRRVRVRRTGGFAGLRASGESTSTPPTRAPRGRGRWSTGATWPRSAASRRPAPTASSTPSTSCGRPRDRPRAAPHRRPAPLADLRYPTWPPVDDSVPSGIPRR